MAYEMRISDWSLDVCSSDLHGSFRAFWNDPSPACYSCPFPASWSGPCRTSSPRSRHPSLNGPCRAYCPCPSLPSSRGPSTCPCQTWSTVAALPSAGSRIAFRLEVPVSLVHLLILEERRGGKDCVSTCRSGWSPFL